MGLGDYIPVERGTLIFPWGANRVVVEVFGMQAVHDAPVISTLGPVDLGTGTTTFEVGDRDYEFRIIGKYTSGGAGATTLDVPQNGNATISLGSGETWSGPVKVSNGRWSGRWNDKRADASLSIKFDGKPTITPTK